MIVFIKNIGIRFIFKIDKILRINLRESIRKQLKMMNNLEYFLRFALTQIMLQSNYKNSFFQII